MFLIQGWARWLGHVVYMKASWPSSLEKAKLTNMNRNFLCSPQSLVLVSKLPYVTFFHSLLKIMAPEYFEKQEPCLEAGKLLSDCSHWLEIEIRILAVNRSSEPVTFLKMLLDVTSWVWHKPLPHMHLCAPHNHMMSSVFWFNQKDHLTRIQKYLQI